MYCKLPFNINCKNIGVAGLKDPKNYLVVKSNKLVEANYKLTLNEHRLIFTLIAQIKPEDQEFEEYFIKINDLKTLFEITTNDYYSRIKKITKSLLSKPLSIPTKEGILQCNWISSAHYFDNEGTVKLRFDPALKPYLLQLKSYFTAYGLDNIIRLKSVYSIRLYELLLKEYHYYSKKRINFVFSIKELKAMLGIEEDEYPFFANFKVKVLYIAEKELKAKSNLYFEYKTIKTGRAITDIEFFVIHEEEKQRKLTNKENYQGIIDVKSSPIVEEQETDEIIKRLIELGFQDYKKIKEEHSDEVILNAFADLDFEIEDRKKKKKDSLKNIGAWVRRRLPIAGQPFQRSLHHNKYLEEQDQKKQQEEIKQQEQLKAKIERDKKENLIKELDDKINARIEYLKLNSPEEWEEIEKEVSDRVTSELKPPKQEKEEKEIIKAIISELTEKDRNILELDAVEKAKISLADMGITEDSKSFNNIMKSVKTSTFEKIIKERYLSEIQSQLKESSYYKTYEKKFTMESNEIRRRIIIKKLKDDI
jgi:plasmid replication initiation protein